jgi:hypothetical protein
MMFFHFQLSNFGSPILKVESNRIFFKMFILAQGVRSYKNGLHVDKILIFQKFQVSGVLKDIYVLSYYALYNHNTSNL